MYRIVAIVSEQSKYLAIEYKAVGVSSCETDIEDKNNDEEQGEGKYVRQDVEQPTKVAQILRATRVFP